MLNICVVPHPTEDRPCGTRFAHSLEECPQCGGTVFVDEAELDRLMQQAGAAEAQPKRGRGPKVPTPRDPDTAE